MHLRKIIAVDFSQRNVSDEFTGFSRKYSHSPVADYLAEAKMGQFIWFRWLQPMAMKNLCNFRIVLTNL